jgi:hypothetical protein
MRQSIITIPAIIGTALVTAAIVSNTPAQQDRPADPVIASLSTRVDELTDRVARIEHASGGVQSTEASGEFDHEEPPDLSNARGGRWMIIDNIQTSQFSPDYSAQLADLQDQAASLERTIENERQNMRDLQMVNRGGQRDARSHRQRSQRSLINRYTGELSRTNSQIKDLARAMNELTQIIHGHEGDTIITLQTTKDLNSMLSNISTGDYVTWTGRRIDMSSGHESWEASSVRLLE